MEAEIPPRVPYTGGDMNQPILCCSILALAVAALPAASQTASSHSAAAQHHTTTTAAHHGAGCALHPPAISPKIPALPPGSPCVKTLYTITRIPTTRLDYASPLLSEGLREELSNRTETFSLDYVDIALGSGEPVAPHKYLSVKYTGYLADEGTKFDSSYDHPKAEPITFAYAQHQVIPGWDTGFEGMRVGGKRRLYIPYELAYGEAGHPPVIPQKAELIFDVEVVSQSDMPPPRPEPTRRPMPPTGARPGFPSGAVHPPAGAPPQGTSTPQSAKPNSQTTPPPQSNPPAGSSTTTPQPQ